MGSVKCGIDRLEIDNKVVRGLRLGLVTNYAGVNSEPLGWMGSVLPGI